MFSIVLLMRAAALFVQLTFFTFTEPKGVASNSKSSRSALGIAIRGRKTAKRRLCRRLRAAIVMVLGATIQFMKRVFHLIVGLLRLSYRKVGRLCENMLIPINEHLTISMMIGLSVPLLLIHALCIALCKWRSLVG